MKRVNCYQCIYFAVTWNNKFPKACKYFGFKTASMPSLTVFQSTGQECVVFKPKK